MSPVRLILVTGKGGVGKTTVAAATAVRAAKPGRRTLVASLDRAHSLGDVLGCSPGSEPSPCPGAANLVAIEIDPQVELRRHWGALQGYLGRLFTHLGLGATAAEEMAVLPGLEELLTLARLAQYTDDGSYDLVVADCAPTADSLRYLSFPQMMKGPLAKWIEWDRRLARLLRPLEPRIQLPVPSEDVYQNLQCMADDLGRLGRVLTNPWQSAVRLVMVPESVVLQETRRAFTYLSLFGVGIDAVVVNRILPPEATGGFLEGWAAVQQRVLSQAAESFGETPRLSLKFQPQEVRGAAALAQVGAELYGARDPALPYADRAPMSFFREGKTPRLVMHLPFAAEEKLDLKQQGGDLIFTVGGWRRIITLPDALGARRVRRARLTSGRLEIDFADSAESAAEQVAGGAAEGTFDRRSKDERPEDNG